MGRTASAGLMKDHISQWLNRVHAWIALLSVWILFAVFVTGTLTVFDEEITYWMQQPQIHEITTASEPGLSRRAWLRTAAFRHASAPDRSAGDPSARPAKWQDKRTFSGQSIDPATGHLMVFRETRGETSSITFTMDCSPASPAYGRWGRRPWPCWRQRSPGC